MDAKKHQQFAQRLVRNQNKVFRYVVSMVVNRADAEEIFQQTCLTLWENWEQYDPALDFLPWACGFAYNHIRNHRRKMENRQVLLDRDVVEQLQQRALGRQPSLDDRRAALLACLEELPEEQRTSIESYYERRQTVEQIAEQRSATPNAIYKMLRRIRTALFQCITRRLAAEAMS